MKIVIVFFSILLIVASCQTPSQKQYSSPRYEEKDVENVDIDVSMSANLPKDGSAPVAGIRAFDKADTIITFSEVGQRVQVRNGQNINFIYDGINPEETYIIYEQTLDGYTLELAYRNQKVNLPFNRLCQIYIVASPQLTTCEIPDNLKFEQIVWTPRSDGTWEVRLGTVERGCKSPALDQLQKLRTKDYEGKVPRK